jgi:hypothetical protein
LADYEGHMSAQDVQQLGPLSALFADVLARLHPVSVAILGVAGGNGLEAIDSTVTRRVAGFDFNRTYLDAVATRFAALPGLELHCVNLSQEAVACPPVQLVHVALLLEHAGTAQCLDNAIALVAPDGYLSVVLQLPSELEQGVSSTPYRSLQALKPHFQLVCPDWLTGELDARGFFRERESRTPLPAGKAFWHGIFRRSPVSDLG